MVPVLPMKPFVSLPTLRLKDLLLTDYTPAATGSLREACSGANNAGPAEAARLFYGKWSDLWQTAAKHFRDNWLCKTSIPAQSRGQAGRSGEMNPVEPGYIVFNRKPASARKPGA
ncbi:hypothetical protein FOL47_000189, partial [Perkinsus chesapeaki]